MSAFDRPPIEIHPVVLAHLIHFAVTGEAPELLASDDPSDHEALAPIVDAFHALVMQSPETADDFDSTFGRLLRALVARCEAALALEAS